MTKNEFAKILFDTYTGTKYKTFNLYAEKTVDGITYKKELGPYTESVIWAIADEYFDTYQSDIVLVMDAETGEIIEEYKD